MIFGYKSRTVNDEYGLLEMREVSVSATPEAIRALARFLMSAADEIEPISPYWHKHAPPELRAALGCDFLVLSRAGGTTPEAT